MQIQSNPQRHRPNNMGLINPFRRAWSGFITTLLRSSLFKLGGDLVVLQSPIGHLFDRTHRAYPLPLEEGL